MVWLLLSIFSRRLTIRLLPIDCYPSGLLYLTGIISLLFQSGNFSFSANKILQTKRIRKRSNHNPKIIETWFRLGRTKQCCWKTEVDLFDIFSLLKTSINFQSAPPPDNEKLKPKIENEKWENVKWKIIKSKRRWLCRKQLVCAADETAGPGQGKGSTPVAFVKKLSSLFKTILFRNFLSVGGGQCLFIVKIDCWERLSTVQPDTTSVLYTSTNHFQKYQ
jgi:hypothetical protein